MTEPKILIMGTLTLNGYFTTALKNKHRDQEVQVIVYLPEGAHLIAAQNTSSFHRNDSRYGDLLESGTEEKLLILEQGELTCETCPDDHDQIDEGDWMMHLTSTMRQQPEKKMQLISKMIYLQILSINNLILLIDN